MNKILRIGGRGNLLVRGASRTHTHKKATPLGPGEEEMQGIEQFAAEQSSLPARNPELRGSGVQQDVRQLYRDLLREANKKLDPEVRDRLQDYIKSEFAKNASLPRMQFSKIEWLIRQGKNNLDILRNTDPMDGFNTYKRR
eukprot:TRINITY_DN10192_c0_g1_i1.p1 TRINITY_DN10192_c0_g1~~TRINITY_DN10192_c0_g1_i1.p1  ORF type:complete len:141 (+),score=17.23 TRINITY_DN10192_c0_g1_i1:61-483(+)